MKTADPPELPPPTTELGRPANDSVPLVRGVFEPPESLVLSAIGYHKRIIIILAVLGALAGAAFGLLRPVTYEAAATLQVGQVNPNSPGFASYTQSSSSLATAFSRAIAAAPVLKQVNDKLHLAKAKASANLSSEAIPLSPAFRVIATGPSAAEAMRLANVAATGVVTYVNHSNSANPEAASLLSAYRRASLELSKATDEVAQLGSLEAKAAQSAAKIKLKAIASAYIATVGSQPPREGFISLLAGATSATSDRKSRVELYGFLGLLLGGLIGCCIAVLRERRLDDPPSQSQNPSLRPRPIPS
jgi:capsular polysaccharide biosynthesis protein